MVLYIKLSSMVFHATVYTWNEFLINISKVNILSYFEFLFVTSSFHDAYVNQE